ncbi:hypothetical protein GUJ93_ZPchr0003g17123 [Zizania palustris]|uniref:Uncharacterized protein n=1 Tax=Zizania palustris TaxID=103762 RepID=A0A8J5V7Q5_ZIZPA|nr:hypothetical protein GUJ93_ZPchr0003g17123 [Zizania palustris]
MATARPIPLPLLGAATTGSARADMTFSFPVDSPPRPLPRAPTCGHQGRANRRAAAHVTAVPALSAVAGVCRGVRVRRTAHTALSPSTSRRVSSCLPACWSRIPAVCAEPPLPLVNSAVNESSSSKPGVQAQVEPILTF